MTKTNLNLSKYMGLPYGEPYDCFGLVQEVRKDLGLLTPTLYIPDSALSQISQLKDHMEMDLWIQRANLYDGKMGDIILMSSSNAAGEHHMGVVIGLTEIIHVDLGRTVALLPIGRIIVAYPGKCSRWGLTGWSHFSP